MEQPDRIVIYDQLNRELWVDTKEALPSMKSPIETSITSRLLTSPQQRRAIMSEFRYAATIRT